MFFKGQFYYFFLCPCPPIEGQGQIFKQRKMFYDYPCLIFIHSYSKSVTKVIIFGEFCRGKYSLPNLPSHIPYIPIQSYTAVLWTMFVLVFFYIWKSTFKVLLCISNIFLGYLGNDMASWTVPQSPGGGGHGARPPQSAPELKASVHNSTAQYEHCTKAVLIREAAKKFFFNSRAIKTEGG